VNINRRYLWDGGRILDRDINRPLDSPGGLALLALSSSFDFDGYRLYPPSDTPGRLARAQGGHIDAQEDLWRETAALAAFHHFDSVGIIHKALLKSVGGPKQSTDLRT
jgi:hypothetical protein